MIDYPELILRLLMVLPHLSGMSMLLGETPHAMCLSEAIHLQKAEEHNTAQHGQLKGHMHTQGRQPHRQAAKCC